MLLRTPQDAIAFKVQTTEINQITNLVIIKSHDAQ